MRRVAAPWKDQRLRPSNAAVNGFNVGYRAIFVVFALNDQSGARNRAEIFFNVPVAKLRLEPNIAPTAKHFVGMRVIARKFFAQVAGLIHFANCDSTSEAKPFDKDVRRLQNKSANLFRPSACVNQSDRTAVAMPNKNGPLNAKLCEKFRKHCGCFVMHKIGSTFLCKTN